VCCCQCLPAGTEVGFEDERFSLDGGEETMRASTLTVEESAVHVWRDPQSKLHRVNGPSIEYPDGSADWFKHGALVKKLYTTGTIVHYRDVADGPEEDARLVTKHRLDGPAVICLEGLEFWYVGDQHIDPDAVLGPLGTDFRKWETWTDIEKVVAKLALIG
jgi:hypothetical protein